jgi:cytochrome c551/c552
MSDHHDHPLPPPEPDAVEAGGVTVWGIISFISVLAVVFGLSGYFWMARHAADDRLNVKYGESAYRKAMNEEKAEKLKAISAAMKAMTDGAGEQARAMHWNLPVVQAAPAPTTPVTAQAAPAPFKVNAKLAAKGKVLFGTKTCMACHSVDGTRIVGPSLKGFWGRKTKTEAGEEFYADQAYFTKSIKEPMAQISAGYPPAMAQLPVSDSEIEALLHYVASLK